MLSFGRPRVFFYVALLHELSRFRIAINRLGTATATTTLATATLTCHDWLLSSPGLEAPVAVLDSRASIRCDHLFFYHFEMGN
jgi:hypothetical protein